MARYRTKPVVKEAWQYEGIADPLLFPDWMKAKDWYWSYKTPDVLHIVTLEGDMIARPGDWIVKGIQGEIYPVKPDIFDATYEKVDD